MFIRSERLFLRPGWPEDWHELIGLMADREVAGNLASAPWPYTSEHAREFAERPQQRMLPHFFITLPGADGPKLIGSVGLGRDGDEVELGYWIARAHWGNGYATEAARAVLGLARALGHRRVIASHFADNPASGRVLRKAGFAPTGKTRMRHSAARGGEAPANGYAITLDCLGGGDDDLIGGDGNAAAVRAA